MINYSEINNRLSILENYVDNLLIENQLLLENNLDYDDDIQATLYNKIKNNISNKKQIDNDVQNIISCINDKLSEMVNSDEYEKILDKLNIKNRKGINFHINSKNPIIELISLESDKRTVTDKYYIKIRILIDLKQCILKDSYREYFKDILTKTLNSVEKELKNKKYNILGTPSFYFRNPFKWYIDIDDFEVIIKK